MEKPKESDWWGLMLLLVGMSIGYDCWKSPAFWIPLIMRIYERWEKYHQKF